MRRNGGGLGLLAAALLGLAGCASTDPFNKPPKHPEEYIQPPDLVKFSQPPKYRDSDLNQDTPPKQGFAGGPNGMGGMGGMGGMPGAGMGSVMGGAPGRSY
jgi:hypothetical protein